LSQETITCEKLNKITPIKEGGSCYAKWGGGWNSVWGPTEEDCKENKAPQKKWCTK
jgi:hypothetical protein